MPSDKLKSSASQTQSLQSEDLLNGKIGPVLIRLALPMVFGILSIILFNIVDTFYVGHLGPAPLAALSFTFPITFLLISLSIGLSIGTSATIAMAIGRGDDAQVKRLATDGILLTFLLALVVAGLGALTIQPVFRALGAEPELLPTIRAYMLIWFGGVGLLAMAMAGNSCLRATGDTTTPSLIMILVGVFNMVVDPFFIFGWGPFPRWGVPGAAVVTVIAWALGLCATLWILIRKRQMLTATLPTLSGLWASWKKILHIGLPASVTNMLVPLGAAVLTRILADFGEHPVAAFGVGTRVESLSVLGMLALSAVMTPFVGQNWGAGKKARVARGIWFCVWLSLVWSAVLALVLWFLGAPLGRLFSDNEQIVSLVKLFFRIVPWSLGFYGITMIVNAAYNALHRPLWATLIVVLRVFVFSVPLAFLGAHFWGVGGVFGGMAVGNLLGGLLAWLWIQRYLKAHRPEKALESEYATLPSLPEGPP